MRRLIMATTFAIATALTPTWLLAGSVMDPTPLDRYVGEQTAPKTLLVYTAPTCSNCVDFERQILPELHKRYVETGKLRLVHRPFIRNSVDAVAFMVIASVNDANKEKAFAAFTDNFEKITQPGSKPVIHKIAASVGIDSDGFERLLKDQKLLDELNRTMATAMTVYDVRGTPAFFLDGKLITPDGTIRPFAEAMDAKTP
ncbi:DsbA family protein [Agrobacterium tumefaciens]|uniref:DsbA family protein n=1 Tax=Agrobacterium tumefaciens TaxID=358 RepID=UPI0021CE61B6|nr:DsbA family protein [Agrobacterium tumefaciens]UXS01235.1 thioredoxin domain-containing protein [Agrobacterium tumefaciens]